MAWTYFCEADQTTLTAATKEDLAQKVMEHSQQIHDQQMTREQARESVEKNAKQTAA
jgi:hypothetical protein